MKGWLLAPLLAAVALAPVSGASEAVSCSGGETDANATPLPGGYYATSGANGAIEIWWESNEVPGLQRTMRSCSNGQFTDADWKVAVVGGVCVGLICGL